jgi:hypothetical protein
MTVANALSYKPEGRELETWWGEFFFNLPNPSICTKPWGLLGLLHNICWIYCWFQIKRELKRKQKK